MKIFKTYTQFINEQDGINIGDPAASAPVIKSGKAGSSTDKTKGSGQGDNTKPETPVANPTDPDQAVMDKLLKMPQSRPSTLYNTNEEKPAKENGVTIEIPKTGRSYNFRSKPLTLVVYINDGSGKDAYRGTYTMTNTEITTKSNDGKITEVIDIASGKLAVDPTTKQTRSNLPSNETAAQQQKGVAATVASAIKANSGAFNDANETVVYNAIEAALYWIIKNKLTSEKAREFMATTFTDDAVITVTSMEIDSWTNFLYGTIPPSNKIMKNIQAWKIEWQPENDAETKYLADKVKNGSALFSYEPSGDDAKKWAETIWTIIDDNWVSVDEETNAVLAILALTPKGLLNVDASWKDLQTLGIIDTDLSVEGAISDEIDAEDTAELVKRFAAALRSSPSDGAKKLLELS